MEQQRGAELLTATVRSLETSRLPAARLHQAVVSFTEGMERYHAQDFRAAQQRLLRAASALRIDANPLALEAELYAAICLYYTDSSAAWDRFARLYSPKSMVDNIPASAAELCG